MVWIGLDASFNDLKFVKLLSELKRMHWLGAIVIETIPVDLGICDLDFNEIRTEQCPLTHEQFEKLENTLPEIRVQKSCFEYAPPQPRD